MTYKPKTHIRRTTRFTHCGLDCHASTTITESAWRDQLTALPVEVQDGERILAVTRTPEVEHVCQRCVTSFETNVQHWPSMRVPRDA